MNLSRGLATLALGALAACATTQPSSTPAVHPIEANELLELNGLFQGIQANPDAKSWDLDRQKVVLALGDRVVDKKLPDVFKAIVVGLGTMNVQTTSTELGAGFIAASGHILPPARRQPLNDEAAGIVIKDRGFDEARVPVVQRPAIALMVGNYGRPNGISVNLQAQNDKTLVKVRITELTYPKALAEAYQTFWNAVDKQGFFDKNVQ